MCLGGDGVAGRARQGGVRWRAGCGLVGWGDGPGGAGWGRVEGGGGRGPVGGPGGPGGMGRLVGTFAQPEREYKCGVKNALRTVEDRKVGE